MALQKIRMRHIRCFQALCTHKSVTAAAAALNTVQPALSRTLRELEETVGGALFERTAQGLVLTNAGETLRRHVSTGMAQIERGLAQASGLEAARKVSIGMLPNVARTLVLNAVARFKAVAPDVDVRLHWASVPELVDRLRKGEIDFICGRLLSSEHVGGLSFEHLYSEPLIFVVRPDHELAGRKGLTLEEIDRHLVIVPLPGTIIRAELDRYTFARGLTEFSNKIETVSFEFVRPFLQSNDCVGCLPLGAVRQELAEGRLVQLGLLGDELMGSVGMSFVTGRELSPAAAQLAEALRTGSTAYVTS